MRIKKSRLLLVAIAIVCFLINGSNVYAKEKIFSLSIDHFKPYHWYDEKEKKVKGIFIDICEEIIHKRLGYKIEYYEYPWERAQMQVKEGVHDAFITTPTTERLTYTQMGEEAFVIIPKKIFTGFNNPRLDELSKVQKIEDLRGFRLLGYAGDGWGKEKIEIEAGIERYMVNSIGSVLKMLAKNRGDAFVSSPPIVNYELRKLGLSEKVVELPVVFEDVAYKLLVGKESEFRKELHHIDKILSEMRADGTIQKIIDRWR